MFKFFGFFFFFLENFMFELRAFVLVLIKVSTSDKMVLEGSFPSVTTLRNTLNSTSDQFLSNLQIPDMELLCDSHCPLRHCTVTINPQYQGSLDNKDKEKLCDYKLYSHFAEQSANTHQQP